MTKRSCFSTHLSVAAAAHTPVPLRHLHTVTVLEQEVVRSHHVHVGVAAHRAIQVVKDRVFVPVQIVVLKPLTRTAKKRPKGHLDTRGVLKWLINSIKVSLGPLIVCVTNVDCRTRVRHSCILKTNQVYFLSLAV